jgi:hypothetical protein
MTIEVRAGSQVYVKENILQQVIIMKTEIEVQVNWHGCWLLVLNCWKTEDRERTEGMEMIYGPALFTST